MILERSTCRSRSASRARATAALRDDLLAFPLRERIFRVLEYMLPVATAVEFAHLVRDTCHRDIKPANILVSCPTPNLRGSQLEVRLADFNVGKVAEDPDSVALTRLQAVPGTLYFQTPEQETNVSSCSSTSSRARPRSSSSRTSTSTSRERHVLALQPQRALPRSPPPIARARRSCCRRRSPSRARSTCAPRRQERRSPGRHLLARRGVLLLITGAYANPKNLYDAFHKFIEYERARREQLDRRVPRARVPHHPEPARAEEGQRRSRSSRRPIASSATSTTSTATAS